jgi:polyribonucleotide nucleotidyltransferase
MGRIKRYRPSYVGKDIAVDAKNGTTDVRTALPRPRVDVAPLQALVALSKVPVTRVEAGKRTLSEKQVFLALHATDSYQFDMRHFVGDLQAKVGVRSPRPVEPRPRVEKTPDEVEAEREVSRRRNWGRYWARKRRQD